MKIRPALCTLLAVPALFSSNVQGQEIVGSIGFGSLGAAITGGTFATATSFTPTQPFITTETGVYTGPPLLTPVTFSGFQLNPLATQVTPLWTFNVGAITYSFDATTVASSYDATLHEWDIGGDGVATVSTGHSDAGNVECEPESERGFHCL